MGIERGEVPLERVRLGFGICARRCVSAKAATLNYGLEVEGRAPHRRLAREAAQKSIVLLKNESGLLPLRNVSGSRSSADLPTRRIPARRLQQYPADLRHHALGSPRAALGNTVELAYDSGEIRARVAATAEGADAALVVVGYTHADEGEYIPPDIFADFLPSFPPPDAQYAAFAEGTQGGAMDTGMPLGGDRERLSLNPRDEALIRAVCAANPRTIVAVMAGSAVIMEAWAHQAQAILMLWYPGQEGGHAFADYHRRSARAETLPCTRRAWAEISPSSTGWPKFTYDLCHGYRKLERDGAAPAFPFGFGLSYTTFDYAGLKLARAEIDASAALEATVE